jgi:hypothetical protein
MKNSEITVIVVEKNGTLLPVIVALLFSRTTTTNTGELWTELAWCTILLATVISPTVVIAVPARRAVGSLTTASTTTGACLCGTGTSRLAMGLRDNFCGEVKPLPEVLNTFRCERVIVPLP